METIRFKCPSCGTKLAPVEQSEATQILKRTCSKCRETWQLKVEKILAKNGIRMDRAEFTFLGRKSLTPRSN